MEGIYVENMTVHRSKVRYYLGMGLDYSEKGYVKLLTIKYINKVLTKFPELIWIPAANTAADWLIQVRGEEGDKPLLEE